MLLFWLPVLAMMYHWLLYPLLLWGLGSVRSRQGRSVSIREWPFVSVVIAAYNEAQLIEAKIRNCIELDYPRERMEILVGSDCSTDGTDDIVRGFDDERIRLIRYEPQSGKTVVQNRLLVEARGDLVLCTDVDSLLTSKSLALMVKRMADPRVAVVNPRYARVNMDGSAAESLYDRWETLVKRLEGRLGAMVGCNAYANLLRGSVATPIPEDTNLDDFVLGIRPFRMGYDVVTEPDALVVTQTETEGIEFRRKARINRGNLQALLRFLDLLHPKYGIKAWTYFSHKVLRMVIPFLLVCMLVASAVRSSEPFYLTMLVLQGSFIASAPLVLLVRGRWRRLLVPQYYYLMNLALLVGFWQFFFHREKYWSKTPRQSA
jgi:cellulose synthase/poly-beta-1,6-N-acetylglucosamine synthase-like glycosyltransferase